MPNSIAYSGYRIYVRNISVVKQKGKEFLLQMELINTGKRPIAFGPGFPARYLQTRFDESLKASGLLSLGPQIREGILNTREKLEVGVWRKDFELTVRSDMEIEYKKYSKDDFERVASTINRRPTAVDNGTRTQSAASAKTDDDCVDLTLVSVEVLQQDKKKATVQLTIMNSGSTDLSLSTADQGLSLTVFVSGSPRLSSSSKRIKQINLSDRLSAQNQTVLSNGENIVLVERIDISEATRYTAVLIAQLDSGQVLSECDETNNERHALLFE